MIDGAQIQMASGEYVWPYEPWRFVPRIDDIAHHLAGIFRFTGLTRYTVAQHAVHVAEQVPRHEQRWALLHDAPEAYLGDMAAPLKHADTPEGRGRREAERALMHRICNHFMLLHSEPQTVRDADARMAVTERRDLLPRDPDWRRRPGWVKYADVLPLPERIVPWPPVVAKRVFLERYEELSNLRRAA